MGFVLKEKQIEAIDSFVTGKDVFVSLLWEVYYLHFLTTSF